MTTRPPDPWAEWRARQVPQSPRREKPGTNTSHWRAVAQRVVTETMLALRPDATRKEAERALREAYPFGEREYWPYRVWLREQAAALRGRFGP